VGGLAAGAGAASERQHRVLLCLSLDPRALPPPSSSSSSTRSPSSAAEEGMLVSAPAMAAARAVFEAVRATGILAEAEEGKEGDDGGGHGDNASRMEALE